MPRKKKSNIERTVQVKLLDAGNWQAFVRREDTDGKVRTISARGETKQEALARLDAKIVSRVIPTPRIKTLEDICADHTVLAAAQIWLSKERAAQELSKRSLAFYEGTVRSCIEIRPGIRSHKIGDVTAGQIEKHMVGIRNGTIKPPVANLKRAGQAGKTGAPSQAQNFRIVMSLILKQAIRDGARSDNPVLNLKRSRRKVEETRALTSEQIAKTEQAIAEWRAGKGMDPHRGGRPRDPEGVLPDVVSLLLGTGVRISEALALRPIDCDLDAPVPFIRIRGTVKSISGEGLIREDLVKTSDSRRDLAVPQFVALALRRQIELHAKHGLVFATTKGTLVNPHNLRDNLRRALRLAGIENAELKKGGLSPITPHAYRRTLATRLAEASDEHAARDHLGHSSVAITKKSYIAKQRVVIGDAALIEGLFGSPPQTQVLTTTNH